MFLILLVLIWFSLQIFLLILSKSIQAFFCRPTWWSRSPGAGNTNVRKKTKEGKGETPAVLACSGLSCGEAMFVVAFYGLLAASNHYEVNNHLKKSGKIGRICWTSSRLAVFLVKGGRIHLATSGNTRMLCYVKRFFCLGNDFETLWVFSQWVSW